MNIHFQQGVYSEYPRFLKACLAGKPFISEPMGDPLVEGVHYLPLDEFPTAGTTERLFAAIRDLAARYSFSSLLETIIREKVTGV